MLNLIELIEQKFFESLEASGIKPRYSFIPVMDGKIHRFATAEDRQGEKSGGYYIHADGWPNWGIIDYRKGFDSMLKFKISGEDFPGTKVYSAVRSRNNFTPKDEKEQARAKAYIEWKRATPVIKVKEYHSYLIKKKICYRYSDNIRQVLHSQKEDITKNGDLLIPLVNIYTHKFQSLQRITFSTMKSTNKNMKGFYPNTILKSACYIFSQVQTPPKFIICEGFATGASIFYKCCKTTKATVISSMSCNNMLNIVKGIRTQYKGTPIIIAADNDPAGLKTGQELIREGLADSIAIPPISGYDWNDFLSQSD